MSVKVVTVSIESTVGVVLAVILVVVVIGGCVVVLLVVAFTTAKEMATRANSTPTEKCVRATMLAARGFYPNGILLWCAPCICIYLLSFLSCMHNV